jgi:bifunctional non-homologous end joining protein LigD
MLGGTSMRAAKKASPVSARRAAARNVAGVPLTHPDRVLYPEEGLTKRDLAEFYDGISGWMLRIA